MPGQDDTFERKIIDFFLCAKCKSEEKNVSLEREIEREKQNTSKYGRLLYYTSKIHHTGPHTVQRFSNVKDEQWLLQC